MPRYRGDETVNVEQRHHAHARVGFAQAVGVDDRPRRGDQIALSDRHGLRPARGATGVQEQRNGRRVGGAEWRRACLGRNREGTILQAHRYRGDAGGTGCRDCIARTPLGCLIEQSRHLKIGELGSDLPLAECRVQRRRGSPALGDGKEGENQGRAIRSSERNSIAVLYAQAAHERDGIVQSSLKLAIGQPRSGLGHDERRVIIRPGDEIPKSCRAHRVTV